MERISIYPCNAAAYDRMVHEGTVPEAGDLAIASKAGATKGGQPGVVIGFTVHLPDGVQQRVQAVTTLRALEAAVRALCGAHPVAVEPGAG